MLGVKPTGVRRSTANVPGRVLMAAMKAVYEDVHEVEVETGRIAKRSIADRIYGFVSKHELLVLGIVLVAVAASSLVHSHHKQFWLDEIFTIIVSTQPDLHH